MDDFDFTPTRANLMQQIETYWSELKGYLGSLTEAQLTESTDAAGWTVKDHVIHIAKWEEGALARIEGKSKREVLNIDPETWAIDDDARSINAVLQKRYQDIPLADAMQALTQNHDLLLQKLNTMSEEDLLLPYNHYQPDSDENAPIIDWVIGDTAFHYYEHIPWIKAIVENK